MRTSTLLLLIATGLCCQIATAVPAKQSEKGTSQPLAPLAPTASMQAKSNHPPPPKPPLPPPPPKPLAPAEVNLPDLPAPPIAPPPPAPPSSPAEPNFDLPPPPAPPAPPKIKVPVEAHAACQDKPDGMEIEYRPNSNTLYKGHCQSKKGRIFFKVEEVMVER